MYSALLAPQSQSKSQLYLQRQMEPPDPHKSATPLGDTKENMRQRKNVYFFVCSITLFANKKFGDFVNVTLTRVESFGKNLTRVESSQHRLSA